jgi:hypothetical protein
MHLLLLFLLIFPCYKGRKNLLVVGRSVAPQRPNPPV